MDDETNPAHLQRVEQYPNVARKVQPKENEGLQPQDSKHECDLESEAHSLDIESATGLDSVVRDDGLPQGAYANEMKIV